ncbi:alpha/beta hydrolase [Gordonia sp. NPDC003950]
MRPNISALCAWNTDAITGAGEATGRAAQTLDGARHAFADSVQWPFYWFGRTHDAARRCVAQEADHVDEVRNVLQQITDEAKDAGTDLTHARQVVLLAVAEALRAGYDVSDTGMVTHPQAGRADGASAHQGRIQRGLDVIDEIDELYGARLDDLRGDLAAMVGGQPDITVPGIGTLDADTMVDRLEQLSIEQRATLLAGLSPTDMRRLIQADPERVGNLDGVPFEIRGIANEINIRNALATEIRTHGPDTQHATTLRSYLGQRTIPLDAKNVNSGTAQEVPEGIDTERVYVSFTDGENPRLIEMVGSLTARTTNATVYVPGTGTNANGYGGSNWQSAWNLAQQTGGPVFIYLDGELPQTIVDTDAARNLGIDLIPGNPIGPFRAPFDGLDVASDTSVDPHYAQEMAPRLVAFGQALDAEIASTAPGASTTFVGHSYGGSVVGSAEQLGLRADNVIFASSAGTGVFDAPWDNANPNVARYSLTAPGDPIQTVQSLPGNPHGSDPDSEPGVTRLDTGFYGDGSPVEGVGGHGDYWNDPQSDAFAAMVEVIRGGHPPEYVPRGPDGLVGHYGSEAADAAADRLGRAATRARDAVSEVLSGLDDPAPGHRGFGVDDLVRALTPLPAVPLPGGLDVPLRLR